MEIESKAKTCRQFTAFSATIYIKLARTLDVFSVCILQKQPKEVLACFYRILRHFAKRLRLRIDTVVRPPSSMRNYECLNHDSWVSETVGSSEV